MQDLVGYGNVGVCELDSKDAYEHTAKATVTVWEADHCWADQHVKKRGSYCLL